MSEYLFEIGTEEIPSDYIRPAITAFGYAMVDQLKTLNLSYDDLSTYATPRRLTISITGLPEKRELKVVKAFGPPARAAFGPDGAPTKAAIGFAKSKGVDISAVKIEKTDKGEYACVEVEEGGEKTASLLASEMEKIVLNLPFPKSMVWGDCKTKFTRPIHWIVSIFDSEVASVTIGGVNADNKTCGHRFLMPEPFIVTGRQDYLEKLEKAYVIADVETRKLKVVEGARAAVSGNGASLKEDEELAEMVAFLTEWPVALKGNFDEEYLSLPDELLVTSMKKHQRMFATVNGDGKLTNSFVGVSNMIVNDENLVVAGYERVLSARLSDAMFFYKEDQKRPLADFASRLDGVVYQKKLGTVGEKVLRVENLARFVAENVDDSLAEKAAAASKLAKADLETLMVYEFPELQGIMGREYGLAEGIDKDVCDAIYEHYLPRYSGDILPSSRLGAIVAIAEKMETLCGCFSVGLIPTSAQDPFALRRQTLGIIQIIINSDIKLSLSALIDHALLSLADKATAPIAEVKVSIINFFSGRLKSFYTANGASPDVVDALLASGFDDLGDASSRMTAMNSLVTKDFYEALSVAFKRVANITKDHSPGEVDETLFEANAEAELNEKIDSVVSQVKTLADQKNYLATLEKIATLRPAVDKLFDDVMIMAEDEKVRINRLNLLCKLSSLLNPIADFSRLN